MRDRVDADRRGMRSAFCLVVGASAIATPACGDPDGPESASRTPVARDAEVPRTAAVPESPDVSGDSPKSDVAQVGADRPLRFWVRDGEDPPRPFASPGEREFTDWTATFVRGDAGRIALRSTRRADGVRESSQVSVETDPESIVALRMPRRGRPKSDWHEFLVRSGPWDQGLAPDTRLAGRWKCEVSCPSDPEWVLAADGSAGTDQSMFGPSLWAVAGDVLVISVNVGGGSHRIGMAAIVSPDRETLCAGPGYDHTHRIFRRVR